MIRFCAHWRFSISFRWVRINWSSVPIRTITYSYCFLYGIRLSNRYIYWNIELELKQCVTASYRCWWMQFFFTFFAKFQRRIFIFFSTKKKSPHGKVQSKKSGKETNKQRKTSPQWRMCYNKNNTFDLFLIVIWRRHCTQQKFEKYSSPYFFCRSSII